MKRVLTIFLQIVIVLTGAGALALMLWEPHLEGRNAHATLFQIYFNDPFLAYAYTASLAFFVALYQAFKLVGYLGRNEAFSRASARALRTIKYCAITLVAFIMGAEAYFFIVQRGKEDIAGGVVIGLFLISVFAVSAIIAARFESTVQRGVDNT
jgi:hypothetical protein